MNVNPINSAQFGASGSALQPQQPLQQPLRGGSRICDAHDNENQPLSKRRLQCLSESSANPMRAQIDRPQQTAASIMNNRSLTIRALQTFPFDSVNCNDNQILLCAHPTPDQTEAFLALIWHKQVSSIIILTPETQLQNHADQFSSYFQNSATHGAFKLGSTYIKTEMIGKVHHAQNETSHCHIDQYTLSINRRNDPNAQNSRSLNVLHVLNWTNQDHLDAHALDSLVTATLGCIALEEDNPVVLHCPDGAKYASAGVLCTAIVLYRERSQWLSDIVQMFQKTAPEFLDLTSNRNQMRQLAELDRHYCMEHRNDLEKKYELDAIKLE